VKNKEIQLIQLYCTVCRHYNTTLAAEAQRLSNNFRPKFTDEECITIYLFGIVEGKFEVKAVYEFIKYYWSEWFPELPSYQKFNKRINTLASVFQILCGLLMTERNVDDSITAHVLDSMPIVVAKQKRSSNASAAKGLCDKGYCSTKGMYYYGVKLHALGQKQYQTLPHMCKLCITPASENDITVAKQWLVDLANMEIYADKMYANKIWHEELAERNVRMLTPVKLKKNQPFLDAADSLLSSIVSSIRQAIESFFNWLQQKTRIHDASKVRSDNGLISFVFARLAAITFLTSDSHYQVIHTIYATRVPTVY
jgi:hypothetical protein